MNNDAGLQAVAWLGAHAMVLYGVMSILLVLATLLGWHLLQYKALPRPNVPAVALPYGRRLASGCALAALARAVAAVLPAFSVGVSRVILRVHYASDVAAGFASGTAWLAVCVSGIELGRWLRHHATRAQGSEPPAMISRLPTLDPQRHRRADRSPPIDHLG